MLTSSSLFFGLVLVASASARYLTLDDGRHPPRTYEIFFNPMIYNPEDFMFENSYDTEYHANRVRRQAQGSVTLNSDGDMGFGAKVPLHKTENNIFSAIGSVDLNNQMQPASRGMGLAIDNVNGHGLTVMKESLPGGDRLSGAGKLNLFHNDNHDVNAKAFVARTMPNVPSMPNFNTVGGGVDYMYKNKVGASLGVASTPFFDRKDYSAMGNLNVFRSPTTSVDFSGGFKKFDTPFMKSNWEPKFDLTFSRSFGGF